MKQNAQHSPRVIKPLVWGGEIPKKKKPLETLQILAREVSALLVTVI